MRQAWAHSPRLAERPPKDSLVRHWPEYATQSAPCTKTSSGMGANEVEGRRSKVGGSLVSDIGPSTFAFRLSVSLMAAISLREFSRARTTRLAPKRRANSTPAALVTVI